MHTAGYRASKQTKIKFDLHAFCTPQNEICLVVSDMKLADKHNLAIKCTFHALCQKEVLKSAGCRHISCVIMILRFSLHRLSAAPSTYWIHTTRLFVSSSYLFNTTCFGLTGHHQVCKIADENCCTIAWKNQNGYRQHIGKKPIHQKNVSNIIMTETE
jgi:hypothetical protein